MQEWPLAGQLEAELQHLIDRLKAIVHLKAKLLNLPGQFTSSIQVAVMMVSAGGQHPREQDTRQIASLQRRPLD